MVVRFTIPGEPKGKGRPKFARVGKGVRTYTPEATANYENLICVEFERQCPGAYFEKSIALEMTIIGYYAIPKSASKKDRALMLGRKKRPIKKVDSSNLTKAVEDALNGVAYWDDVQIVDTIVRRFYDERPRVEVTLKEAEICDTLV